MKDSTSRIAVLLSITLVVPAAVLIVAPDLWPGWLERNRLWQSWAMIPAIGMSLIVAVVYARVILTGSAWNREPPQRVVQPLPKFWRTCVLLQFAYFSFWWASPLSVACFVVSVVSALLLAVLLVLTLMFYDEHWRTRFHDDVVKYAWQRIGRKTSYLPFDNVHVSRFWGSKHRYHLLKEFYRSALIMTLPVPGEQTSTPRDSVAPLKRFWAAGEELLSYLERRWHKDQHPDEQAALRDRIQLELFVLTLFHCQAGTCLDTEEPDPRNPRNQSFSYRVFRTRSPRDVTPPTRAEARKYLEQCLKRISNRDYKPLIELLQRLKETSLERADADRDNESRQDKRRRIERERELMRFFQETQDALKNSTVTVDRAPLNIVCGRLWAALAGHLESFSQFDYWDRGLAKHPDPLWTDSPGNNVQRDELIVPSGNNSDWCDVTAFLALGRLVEFHKQWVAAVPDSVEKDIKGKLDYLENLQSKCCEKLGAQQSHVADPSFLEKLSEDTIKISTFPYLEIWWTPQVVRRNARCAIVFSCLLLVPLLASSARPRWLAGWNSIDHFTQPSLTSLISPPSEIAPAAADFSHDWIGVAGQEGSAIVHRESRIIRSSVTPKPVLDIAGDPGRPRFLVLEDDQGLSSISITNTHDLEVLPLLRAPPQPIWPGVAVESRPNRILAAASDQAGLLLAVEGWGIARSLGQGGDRTRSWQLAQTEAMQLVDARICDRVVWIQESDEGNLHFYAIRRDDLTQIPQTDLTVARVKQFNAQPQTGSVSIVGDRNEIYLHPVSSSPDSSGWHGPFLGTGTDDRAKSLQSPSQIRIARLFGDFVLFATESELYGYDSKRRHLSLIRKDLRVREVVHELSQRSIWDAAIVADRGLYLLAFNKHDFDLKQIDQRDIVQAAVTGDGEELYFTSSGPAGLSVHRLKLLDADMSAELMHAAGFWKSRTNPPQFRALKMYRNNYVFGTESSGALFYHPATHLYRDASKVLYEESRKQKTRTASQVEFFGQSSSRLIASIDDQAMYWSDNENAWRLLEPKQRPSLKRLYDNNRSGDQWELYGLDQSGTVLTYRAGQFFLNPEEYGKTSAAQLNSAESLFSATGDLYVRPDGTYKIAFLKDSLLIKYDSADGNLNQERYFKDNGSEVRQIRVVGEMPQPWSSTLVLTRDGRITRGALVRYGFGGFPFEPTSATSISQPYENRILVAGPNGAVVEYDDLHGYANTLGQIPGVSAANPVIATAIHKSARLAKTREGAVYFQNPVYRRWTKADDVIAWANAGDTAWTVSSAGVFQSLVLPPVLGEAEPQFAADQGMKSFLKSASFAWGPGPGKVCFAKADGQMGVYDVSTDSFRLFRPSEVIKNVQQVVTRGDGRALLLDQRAVYEVSDDLVCREIIALPAECRQSAMHLETNRLKIACVAKSRLHVIEIPDIDNPQRSTHFARGGATLSAKLQLDELVFGQESDAGMVVADRSGNICSYSFETGRWKDVRRSADGDAVMARIEFPGEQRLHMILRQMNNMNSQVLVVTVDSSGSITSEKAPRSVDQIIKQFERKVTDTRWADAWISRIMGENPDRRNPAAKVRILRARPNSEGWHDAGQERIKPTAAGLFLRHKDTAESWYAADPGQGFSIDQFKSVCWSPEGDLWAVANGVLWEMALDEETQGITHRKSLRWAGDFRRVTNTSLGTYAGNIDRIEITPAGQIAVTTIRGRTLYDSSQGPVLPAATASTSRVWAGTVGDQTLHCEMTESGIELEWADPRIRVWSKYGAGLASHAISDLIFDGFGRVLIATEHGLYIRRPDYSLIRFLPEVSVRQFQAFGKVDRRIAMRTEGGEIKVWDGKTGSFVAAGGRFERVVRTAHSVWSMQIPDFSSGPSGRTLTVRHPDDSVRKSRQYTAGEWRFLDDYVNWIGRHPAHPNLVWLGTDDGFWPYDPVAGHSQSVGVLLPGQPVRQTRWSSSGWEWQDLQFNWRTLALPGEPAGSQPENDSPHEVSYEDAAVQLHYSKGIVSLRAQDGKPLFSGGKFFFNQPEDIAFHQDRLFVYIRGRGVIECDPRLPGLVRRLWPDPIVQPRNAFRGLTIEFQVQNGTLLLIARESTTGRALQRYELQSDSPEESKWIPIGAEEPEIQVRIGCVSFRQTDPRQPKFLPFLHSAHPAGTSGPDAEPLSKWWESERFTWDLIQSVGALDEDLIAVTPVGLIEIQSDRTRESNVIFQADGLMEAKSGRAPSGRRDGLLISGSDNRYWRVTKDAKRSQISSLEPEERWDLERESIVRIVDDPQRKRVAFASDWSPRQPAARLPKMLLRSEVAIPSSRLFNQGQFIFDQAVSAAELKRGRQMWLTVAPMEDGSLICLNRLNVSENGISSLELLNVWTISGDRPRRVQTDAEGNIALAVSPVQDDDRPSIWMSSSLPPQWSDTDESRIPTLFQNGEQIKLRLDDFSVQREPRMVWDRSSPFECDPEVPVFANQKVGAASGVTFSFDAFTSLAIDPKGERVAIGTRGGIRVCALDNRTIALDNGRFLPSSSAAVLKPADRRWVRFNSSGKPRWYEAETWVAQQVPAIEGDRFVLQGRQRETSNDAWWFDRRNLGRIMAARRDNRGNVWFVSPQGIFQSFSE